MKDYQELKRLTEILQQMVDKALNRLELVKNNEHIQFDFYNDVKPFADSVKEIAADWKVQVLRWVENEHPKHVHPPQIISCCQNLELISVQAFYKETKEKRFKEMYYAVTFLLENILENLLQAG